jgi:hypothetical protein
MTEGPNTPVEREERDSSGGTGERDVAHAEGGRTTGETAVDDALGMGDDPH